MAETRSTYQVKRGDTLWDLCKEYGSSIAGNTIQQKINTLVQLNGIKNPDLIITGQNLVFSNSGSKSSGSSSSSGSGSHSGSGSGGSSSNAPTAVTITLFGLQAQDTSGRAMYATWSWSRSNTDHYKVRWRYYADGVWWIGSETDTTSFENPYCQSTYSAPANAKKVRISVKPIAKNYRSGDNEVPYWTLDWCTEKEYDFANNPPSKPETPDLEIEELKLTASIDNIDSSELNATEIEFEIVKNNTTKYKVGKAKINTSTNYVSYSCNVAAGADYKVRCRAVRGKLTSAWSDFSGNEGTEPAAVSGITNIKANNYADNQVTVYLEWKEVPNAETYDIEYTNNRSYFDGSDGTTTKTGIEFTHYELTGLTLGLEYFFRVRAVNQNGESDWCPIKSIVIGTTPSAPTTYSSTTTAIVGENVNLYWVHNAEDNSSETYAELWLKVGNEEVTHTIRKSTADDEKDKVSVYTLNTSSYREGVKIEWRVRTAGITRVYGDWSIQRTIDVYAEPTLELSVTDSQGNLIDTLTSFPFYISALAGPNTQSPIGYQVKVTSTEFYETVDETGRTKVVNDGDVIFSKYYDIQSELLLEMTAANIDFVSGVTYRVDCSVTMNSGLTTDIYHEFRVSWTEKTYVVDADISIDEETLTATIRPFCENDHAELIDGITLAVYRREFDGSFTKLATGLNNSNNTYITDPHPALNYARYRVVATEIATGAISYYDVPGYPVKGNAIVIQWDEEWSTYDVSDEYSVEKPAWSGSMLRLPYNVDVSDSNDMDVTFIKYAGREHPVSYYGTQKGVTATWNVDIPKSDTETIYALRRLAVWAGNAYVREPSGSGYWANVKVSFNQKHREVAVPVSFTITRVEGGV